MESFLDANRGGRTNRHRFADEIVQFGWGLGLQQNHDAVTVALVEDLWRHPNTLPGTYAPSLVNDDLHDPLPRLNAANEAKCSPSALPGALILEACHAGANRRPGLPNGLRGQGRSPLPRTANNPR